MNGTGVSAGIARAAQCPIEEETTVSQVYIEDVSAHLALLRTARRTAAQALEETAHRVACQFGQAEGEVFEAQLVFLDSDELWNAAEALVTTEKKCAAWAFSETIDEKITMFEHLDNPYLRERALDLKDIRARVLHLLGKTGDNGARPCGGNVVLMAREVTPSQLTSDLYGGICGVVMEEGGSTSHTVLLANTIGIPCVIGVKGLMAAARAGAQILLDGSSGEVILEPGAEEIEEYESRRARLSREAAEDRRFFGLPSRSADGTQLHIFCNIGSVQDAAAVLANDGGGVGLMRSEFLFLGRASSPSEEEQYIAYRKTAEAIAPRPLVIRTLDIGGDKQVPYLGMKKEENPFLGYRALRFCLEHEEVFLPQLRAVLRAACTGNVRLMFPMVTTVEEFRRARAMLRKAAQQLRREGVPFSEDIPVGMMVEVPSAAILADQFVKEADFFSIGTNDLTQYLLSADRGNGKVAYLNLAYDPAVLRTVYHIARTARGADKSVAICGHAAQNKLLLPVWLAMGITELSVSPGAVLAVRRRLAAYRKEALENLLQEILMLPTAREVRARLEQIALQPAL